jgi:hypothetical protein
MSLTFSHEQLAFVVSRAVLDVALVNTSTNFMLNHSRFLARPSL